ncbi:hypothetical protein E4U21_006829 [Claviceps maximensis]|nr:hypothetical protein E4U21_006829 [Claviceps maximensis]
MAIGSVEKLSAAWLYLHDHATRQLNVSTSTLQVVCGITVLILTTLLGRICLSAHQSSTPRPRRYIVPPPNFPESETTVKVANVKIQDNTSIHCYAPATGQFLGFVDASSLSSIDCSIAAAAKAQKSWAKTSFRERRAVLRSLMQFVLDHAREICRVAALDSGKTLVDAQLGEILVTLEKIQWTLTHGEKALRPSARPTNLLLSHKCNTVFYEPMGVIAALVSWNYPFHNMMGPIISALFAGNAIVVKVSEQTAWSSSWFLQIARGALAAHGHDEHVIQMVACWPQAAAHITSHPDISHITFIGSQPVARHVAANAAKVLTPVVAELGGKDPFIVLDSAPANDLPRIVEIILRGTFQAAGQNCIGIERVIAATHYDKLIEMLTPRVRALRLGPDADVGAMINDGSYDRLEAIIEDAVVQGARLLAGGSRFAHPDYPKGHYFRPTLLVDVTPDMKIAKQECFGPVLTLMRASSSSPHDILAIANAPNFGLGASVFGSERDPAMTPIIHGLKAGMVAVNDFAVYYPAQLPFGGVAGSGYGRFAGEEGLRGICNIKSVCQDRFGWLGIRTAIPPPVQYPVASQDKGWEFAQGVVELGHGGWLRKAKGLRRILGNM